MQFVVKSSRTLSDKTQTRLRTSLSDTVGNMMKLFFIARRFRSILGNRKVWRVNEAEDIYLNQCCPWDLHVMLSPSLLPTLITKYPVLGETQTTAKGPVLMYMEGATK